MNHKYITGEIYHKRFHPKKHKFKYNFFMLDIDINNFTNIKSKFFSINRFNLFSFYTKDHFGSNNDFIKNIEELLEKFSLKKTSKMRFITLPRILGFVFNPISVIILLDENNKPIYLLAEVHNYNNGRVVYKIKLDKINQNEYEGNSEKNMYVSPFFKPNGEYKFNLKYTNNKLSLNITLYEDNKKVLISNFSGKSYILKPQNILKLFLKYIFLTFLVVIRTIYQTIKLKLKGLKWSNPRTKDKIRRY